MKVKVNDTIYDGYKQPVMVILSDKDKKNISNMAPTATRYCMFPDSFTKEEIDKFMEIPEDLLPKKE